MKRLIVYLVLLPLICGVPFMAVGSGGTVGQFLRDIYMIALVPALIVGLVDRFLEENSLKQGIACALAGFITMPIAAFVVLGILDPVLDLFIGVIGALAAAICWAIARMFATAAKA